MYTHTYTVSLHIPCFRSMAGQTANLTDRWIDCAGVGSPNPFIHVVHISAVYGICSCLHIYCDILLDFIIYIFKWSFIIQNLGAFNTTLNFFLSVFAKFSHIFSEHALCNKDHKIRPPYFLLQCYHAEKGMAKLQSQF